MTAFERKKQGFAFAFVVIAIAIMMGIFFRYSMEARARKGYQIISKTSSDMQDTLNQSLSFGIYEAYIMDQMIAKNNEGVDDYLGYFIVKDISGTYLTGSQYTGDIEKIWNANSTSSGNGNMWKQVVKTNTGGSYSGRYGAYVGGSWNFSIVPISSTVRMSKGGYLIKSIKRVDGTINGTILYTANDDGTSAVANNVDVIQNDLTSYWTQGSKKNINPQYQLQLYKNIALKTDDGRYVKDFDVNVTIQLVYPAMGTKTITGLESRMPNSMQNMLMTPVTAPGSNPSTQKTEYIADLQGETETTLGIGNEITSTTILVSNPIAGRCTESVETKDTSGSQYITEKPNLLTPAPDNLQTITLPLSTEENNGIKTKVQVIKVPYLIRYERKTVVPHVKTEERYSEIHVKGNDYTCTLTTTTTNYDEVKSRKLYQQIVGYDVTTIKTPEPQDISSRIISYEINYVGP